MLSGSHLPTIRRFGSVERETRRFMTQSLGNRLNDPSPNWSLVSIWFRGSSQDCNEADSDGSPRRAILPSMRRSTATRRRNRFRLHRYLIWDTIASEVIRTPYRHRCVRPRGGATGVARVQRVGRTADGSSSVPARRFVLRGSLGSLERANLCLLRASPALRQTSVTRVVTPDGCEEFSGVLAWVTKSMSLQSTSLMA